MSRHFSLQSGVRLGIENEILFCVNIFMHIIVVCFDCSIKTMITSMSEKYELGLG